MLGIDFATFARTVCSDSFLQRGCLTRLTAHAQVVLGSDTTQNFISSTAAQRRDIIEELLVLFIFRFSFFSLGLSVIRAQRIAWLLAVCAAGAGSIRSVFGCGPRGPQGQHAPTDGGSAPCTQQRRSLELILVCCRVLADASQAGCPVQ